MLVMLINGQHKYYEEIHGHVKVSLLSGAGGTVHLQRRLRNGKSSSASISLDLENKVALNSEIFPDRWQKCLLKTRLLNHRGCDT